MIRWMLPFMLIVPQWAMSQVSFGEPIKVSVHLVDVRGDLAVSPSGLKLAVRDARVMLRSLGVEMRVVRLSRTKDFMPSLGGLFSREARADWWWQYGRRRQWSRKVDLVHVVFPPMIHEGARWFGGRALGVCTVGTSRAFSFGSASDENGLGASRLEYSSTIIAHEIAHTLGAFHTSAPVLMNPNALALVDQYYPLSSTTFNRIQVKSCLTRWMQSTSQKTRR